MDGELKDKFGDFKPRLNDRVWANIASELSGEMRPIVPIPWWKKWWVYITTAVILLIAGFWISNLNGASIGEEKLSAISPSSLSTNSRESTIAKPVVKINEVSQKDQPVQNVKSANSDLTDYNKVRSKARPLNADKSEGNFVSGFLNTNEPELPTVQSSLDTRNYTAGERSISSVSPYLKLEVEQGSYVPATFTMLTLGDKQNKINKKLEKRHSIEAISGFSVAYRTLHSDIHHDLVNHKNQHESRALSSTFGLIYSYQLTPKWWISSGLIYASYGEAYDFEHELITHNTVNQYQYLSIPINVRRELIALNKWSVSAGLGGRYNFLDKANSSWVDTNTISAISHDNEEKDSSPFSEKTLSWNASLYFNYRLSPKLYLTLQETVDRFENSVYKEGVGLNQRPYAFNTTVGIGIDF